MIAMHATSSPIGSLKPVPSFSYTQQTLFANLTCAKRDHLTKAMPPCRTHHFADSIEKFFFSDLPAELQEVLIPGLLGHSHWRPANYFSVDVNDPLSHSNSLWGYSGLHQLKLEQTHPDYLMATGPFEDQWDLSTGWNVRGPLEKKICFTYIPRACKGETGKSTLRVTQKSPSGMARPPVPYQIPVERFRGAEPFQLNVHLRNFGRVTFSSMVRIASLRAYNYLCAGRLIDIHWVYSMEEGLQTNPALSDLTETVPELCLALEGIGRDFVAENKIFFESPSTAHRLHSVVAFSEYVWDRLVVLSLSMEVLADIRELQPGKFQWDDNTRKKIVRSEQVIPR